MARRVRMKAEKLPFILCPQPFLVERDDLDPLHPCSDFVLDQSKTTTVF
jgi:hypothetical protein